MLLCVFAMPGRGAVGDDDAHIVPVSQHMNVDADSASSFTDLQRQILPP